LVKEPKRNSVRDIALRALLAVEREGAYANLFLQKIGRKVKLDASDLALLTELVYGTLRMQGTIDWVLDQFSKVPVSQMNYIVRNIMRLGVYQILFLDRVPPRAACNEAVEQTKRWKIKGLAGFVNGVLRNVARNQGRLSYPDLACDPIEHITVKYSHPSWLVERWLERFGEDETIALCQANNEPPPVALRCNTLKISPEELQRELERENIWTRSSCLVPEGLIVEKLTFLPELKSFRNGYFVVQDESSMIASLVLNPLPGSFVIDTCSGPGGKTTHLAQLMENRGRILALDVHSHRLGLVVETCQRLGISIVETRLLDARELVGKLEEKAEYILVDAPCSGLGVLRRRPDLRWRVQPEDLPRHAEQQLEILISAGHCLAQGGLLLYSTCSTEPEENNEVIRMFLAEYEEFQLEEITPRLPFPLVWDEDKATASSGFLQLMPHRHGTDGFFLACLRKRGKSR
jgi:16S rRNA (cytosine967-C5)-methyltransferase